MLRRLLGPRPLDLIFEQRECVIVPQTRDLVALHADVFFVATASTERVIEDAHLLWTASRSDDPFRRTRWDRAVVSGRFRYPPQALDIAVSKEPVPVTLTFTDPLIPHGGRSLPDSVIAVAISLRGSKPLLRPLWRVQVSTWDGPANVIWLPAKSASASR
jgi:hypothetical protein